MATEAQLLQGLQAADAAGNTADAQHFADQIKALRAAAPAQVSPQPSAMDKLGAFVGNIPQGLYDIPQSAVELGLKATDALGLTNNRAPEVSQFFKQAGDNFNPGQAAGLSQATAGRFTGQVIGTLPLSGLKAAQLAGKLPTLARVADSALQGAGAAALTSNNSDAPLSQQFTLGAAGGAALPMLGGAVKFGAGKVLPSLLGDITTGAGGSAVKEAFNAGLTGGDAAQALTGSMRGNTPWGQVVEQAKDALANMRAERNAAYRSGMADISKDKTILSFEPIDNAMAKASSVKNFKGQDLDPKTADVRSEIQAAIDNWRSLDPVEYHTPEGFDALKQQIGSIKDNLPYNTPQRVVADNAYNAVRKAISEQAPAYDKVMADYTKASEAVSDIQKELSLGAKGNPATALRKLQSVMRNNANTSWGARADMANTLADNGAPNLMPALAGQSLSAPMPRGMARWGDAAMAVGGGLAHANPLTLAALPLASPRVVGELAYGAGAGGRMFGNGLDAIGLPLPRLQPLGGLSAPSLGVLAPRLAY